MWSNLAVALERSRFTLKRSGRWKYAWLSRFLAAEWTCIGIYSWLNIFPPSLGEANAN